MTDHYQHEPAPTPHAANRQEQTQQPPSKQRPPSTPPRKPSRDPLPQPPHGGKGNSADAERGQPGLDRPGQGTPVDDNDR